MAKRRVDSLEDLLGISNRVRITCRACGHSGLYETAAVLGYFRSRNWSPLLAHAEVRFRCDGSLGGPAGCGARDVRFSAEPLPRRQMQPAKPVPIHPDERARGSRRRS